MMGNARGEFRRAFFCGPNGPRMVHFTDFFLDTHPGEHAASVAQHVRGGTGPPDQGLDLEFWHSPLDSARHNEVCREMVYFRRPVR